ncbi:hypothetical protein SOPP22_17895 [Shewanella sp. OPT22]|nr:hypothetical protein SOPP22_17895 [Shewanella sp. OPT22]
MATSRASCQPTTHFELKPITHRELQSMRKSVAKDKSEPLILSGVQYFMHESDEKVVNIHFRFHRHTSSRDKATQAEIPLKKLTRKVSIPMSTIKTAEVLILIKDTLHKHVHSTPEKIMAYKMGDLKGKVLSHFEYQQSLGKTETRLREAEIAFQSKLQRETSRLHLKTKKLLRFVERERSAITEKLMEKEVKPKQLG